MFKKEVVAQELTDISRLLVADKADDIKSAWAQVDGNVTDAVGEVSNAVGSVHKAANEIYPGIDDYGKWYGPLGAFERDLEKVERELKAYLKKLKKEKSGRNAKELTGRKRMGAIHVSVDELPIGVKKALKQIKFNRRDIGLEKGTSYSPSMASSYGDGYRGYLLIVDIHRGIKDRMTGSWGGANMFNLTNPIDNDNSKAPIPNNCVVIYGNEGARLSATIVAPPDMIEEFEDEEGDYGLTDKERKALDVVGGIKSGARRDEFYQEGLGLYGPDNPIIESLREKGLVKVTRSGIMITTQGKNARRR